MDDTPIDQAPESRPPDATPNQPAGEPFDRDKDLAILESLEVELAEVEAALHRLDTDDAPETNANVETQT
jgi:hypothetical protein